MPNAHAKSEGRSTDHGSRIATARPSVPHPHTQVNLAAGACKIGARRPAPAEPRAGVLFEHFLVIEVISSGADYEGGIR